MILYCNLPFRKPNVVVLIPFVRAAKHVRETVAEATWQAFWLSTIENQPIADVARQLGVRQGVVYLSRCRVLDRIRKLVKQWESEA